MTALLNRLDAKRAARGSRWLLIFICAVLAFRVAIVVVDGVDVDYQPIPFSPATEVTGTGIAGDWRMFGDPAEVDYGLTQALPPTPLSLRLRGVVTGERGYAIIIDAQGNEGVYRGGDAVPGDAEVVTIEARRVVLERDGTREALELPDSGAAATVATASGPVRQSRRQDGPASGIGIASLSSMTSGLGLDADALARRITILPVAGGGFRVRAGREAALFGQLGFHANDIVLAINGQPVNNQGDVRAIFETFRPDKPLAITVRRGDRQLVLTPDLSMSGQVGPR